MASDGSSSDLGGHRIFTGNGEDPKEFRRWKAWVSSKLLTLSSKMPDEAKGAFIYTLLAGKALEAVEHLDASSFQKEGGDKVILDLLSKRFPEKDASDEMSENLTDIFNLRANEGESLKAWISRASEAFDKLQRKTNVSFPEEARGWVILHRAGLTSEQQAVVLARSLGVLKREEIGKAMRSCYPEFSCPKRRAFGAGIVDEDDLELAEVDDEGSVFGDVEQFLAEHQQGDDSEAFEEADVAEALAVTWRERRQDLNRLQKARKFHDASRMKRQFKIEVQELKKKTRCHRCNQIGHWSRECPRPKGSGKGTSSSSGKGGNKEDTGAAVVEHFVAAVTTIPMGSEFSGLYREVMGRLRSSSTSNVHEQLLVSSPGYGILDSGCGKSIIGRDTFEEFKQIWKKQQVGPPVAFAEVSHFRFGNGARETSSEAVKIPVVIAGRSGTIRASLVHGKAPLLISRKALQSLHAKIDFSRNELCVFEDELKVPLGTNAAGQYVLQLLEPSVDDVGSFDEVMLSEPSEPATVAADQLQEGAEDCLSHASVPSGPKPCPSEMPSTAVESGPESLSSCVWSRVDHNLKWVPLSGKQGPYWHQVHRREVTDLDTNKIILDQEIDPTKDKRHYMTPLPKHTMHVRTELWFRPQEKSCPTECLSVHQQRQLKSQVKALSKTAFHQGNRLLVAEVFSPPRFAPAAKELGFAAFSFDLQNGYDFRKKEDRNYVAQLLRDKPPELLVLSPPCTHEGGWHNLNELHMSPATALKKRLESRMYIRFCCQLFQQQVELGKRAVFEHPSGARTWSYAEMQALLRKHFWCKCHMCMYGLRLPKHQNLIRKSTGLLVSHADMQSLGRCCPGKSHPDHTCHDVIAGSAPGIGRISTFAGQYTPSFVDAVLRTVPVFEKSAKQQLIQLADATEIHECEVLVSAKQDLHSPDDETVRKALTKVHKNLGHPSTSDLVRVLKHGGASDKALEIARALTCDFCRAQARPHVPLPAKTGRHTRFNQCIGIDVKYLTGWKQGQKIKAVNIVDQASCFQVMVPFHERETSALLRNIIEEHWIRWAGPPETVVMDPAPTMLGEGLQSLFEADGSVTKLIAAEAHWQLGRTESHGGWFGRVLDKVIQEQVPNNKETWEMCVRQAHVKNQLIQNYGYTPHQFVFGRNPTFPGDLLNEPLHIVPATAGLTNEAIEQAQSIRTSARKAVIELQDDKALRQALLARPRVSVEFAAGELVAYWREQKYSQSQGTVIQGGQWHGTAMVIGKVGRNYIIAHRRQVLRCAPEQLRAATTEEKTLVQTPEAELLGIKDLIEGGTFKGQQYVDLVPGRYPPTVAVAGFPMQSEVESTEPEQAVPMSVEPMQPSTSDGTPFAPTDAPDVQSSQEAKAEQSEASAPSLLPSDAVIMPGPSELSNASEVPSSSYGPIRHRVHGKSDERALFRPPAMREDDFVEIMREVVPQLIDQALHETGAEASTRTPAPKRPLDTTETPEPPASRPRPESTAEETLLVSEIDACNEDIDVLIAAHIQKKTNKELPHSGNPTSLQSLVNESKSLEWNTILEKGAVKIHYGRKAQAIREKFPQRFIGSRFVITRKPLEEGTQINDSDPSTYKVKSRWCLQGHLDPDLEQKAMDGMLQSPTLSQPSRVLLMQVLASYGWDMQLGDIKGAFMEAGELDAKYRPLFARPPAGGIPNVPHDAVIEVVGNVYGQNDAPASWFRTFDSEAKAAKWIPSKFDPCLYTLRDADGSLAGVMGVHVDDVALGGMGPTFQKSIDHLKSRFPFRKWRLGTGEFCGAFYKQDPRSKEISMSQQQFAEAMKPAFVPKGASPDKPLESAQIRVLRGINGSLNWIANQSRPDLSVQTSLSQQCFPNPTINDLRNANNAVRRAKQHKDLTVVFNILSRLG